MKLYSGKPRGLVINFLFCDYKGKSYQLYLLLKILLKGILQAYVVNGNICVCLVSVMSH